MAVAAPAAGPAGRSPKFRPVDCSRHFSGSAVDLGPRDAAKHLSSGSQTDGLLRAPSGSQRFRGIPFQLGHAGVRQKSWIILSRSRRPGSVSSVEIPVTGRAAYICLAQFSDWDTNETPPPGADVLERVGQVLGELTLLYSDGSRQTVPIRRRFEVNSPSVVWGHLCFAALPHRQDVPATLTDSLHNARDWGDLQMGVWDSSYAGDPNLNSRFTLWLAPIANPSPERPLKALRFEASAEDPLVLCGVTLFEGSKNPLQYDRLTLYRITLPEGEHYDSSRWQAAVDLGVISRVVPPTDFAAQQWLSAEAAGFGDARQESRVNHFFVEISASPEAVLTLQDLRNGTRYEFPLRSQSTEARARAEVLEAQKVWIHGRVLDRATGAPTPARIAFRSAEGRYIPPYGHRSEINSGWFQDYGADVKLMDSSFAYIDGTFQVELPVGDVYVEIAKGFEHEPVRRKLQIGANRRELDLEITRFSDLRKSGWVSADTHVHFLSPSTAVLEGQAEGVNLVNLLAAQWGDLFTNVGDLAHGPLASRDGETIVWPASENRQHILGHLGLLGGHGAPVYPMSASGPEESYIGTPLWSSLAEWADRCRKRDGLVVAVHFPYPTAEIAADIALGKIDAVELWPVSMGEQFNNLRFQEWYRYLNCGYRLPAVSGTDKMGAWIAVGSCRAYAHLGGDEFTFANWAKAVRRGNTFVSTGPLLLFSADGRSPGEEISMRAGGGDLEVSAEVNSPVPVHRLEIVVNGAVVASKHEARGARRLHLNEKVRITGPGWIAARCASKYVTGGRRMAAHTSPVYISAPGGELYSPRMASYMLTLIDGAETWASQLATRPDPERLERVLQVFRDARRIIQEQMKRH